jgi:hypothetical protein
MGLGRRGAALVACLGAAAAVPAAAAAAPPPQGLHVASFTAPSKVALGERTEISGRVAPAVAVPVLIERLEGDAWTTIATLRATRAGRFSADLPLRRSGNLRASVQAADGTIVPGRRRFVGIARRVSLRVTATEYQQIAGRPFRAIGRVSGAAKGEKAVIEGSVNGGKFKPLRRVTVRSGRVDATFRPPSGGRWRFRLVAPPRPGIDSGGTGAATAMTVAGTNPHKVPASAPHYLVQAISEMSLYYYQRGELVRVFPVVFGAPSTPTPVGSYRVYAKTGPPSAAFGPKVLWYHRGYGIHGTNQEYLLARSWRYYSHGCTRNYNVNILWLWDRIPVGTPVRNLA